jgi:CRISPR-associated protein Cas2
MKVVTTLVSSSLPPGLRGALNQWMLEVLPGIYVGRVSARIRRHLWMMLTESLIEVPEAYAALIVQDDSEQGFRIESFGPHPYQVHDHAGVQLVTVRRDRRPMSGDQVGLPDPSW